jgi:hypothetical protein
VTLQYHSRSETVFIVINPSSRTDIDVRILVIFFCSDIMYTVLCGQLVDDVSLYWSSKMTTLLLYIYHLTESKDGRNDNALGVLCTGVNFICDVSCCGYVGFF